MNLFLLIIAAITFSLSSKTAFAQQLSGPSKLTTAKNAAEFIQRKSASSGGSAGAGNGGSGLLSEFFREGLVGVESLALTLKITQAQKVAIIEAMSKTKVYPVAFQLCDEDQDTTCADEQAYVAKNYPARHTILLDTRDLATKWKQLGLKNKRRIAAHEFAGIAGIELSNHLFTAQIDDGEVFNAYESKRELKQYFKSMNDFYFVLPAAPAYVFAGEWGKQTVLRPTELQFTRETGELFRGAKYDIQIELRSDGLSNSNEITEAGTGAFRFDAIREREFNDQNVALHDKNYGPAPKPAYDSVTYSDCSGGLIRDGHYFCHRPVIDKWSTKWSGKYKRVFEPSFPTPKNLPVASFSCKVVNEDQLMCRHFYLRRLLAINAWVNVYEYTFYRRLTGSERHFTKPW